MTETAKIICDGCNVNPPWEHRCHGDRAMVLGEQTEFPCECPECLETERTFAALAAAAGFAPKEKRT